MQKAEKLQHQQDLEQYLSKKQVYPLFENLLSQLIKEQPEKPMEFLVDYLKKPQNKLIFIIGYDCSEICQKVAQKLNFKLAEIEQENDQKAFESFENQFKKNENMLIQNFPINLNQAQQLQKLKIIPDLIIFIEEDDEELKNHLKNKLNKDNIEDIINLNKLNINQVKRIHQNFYYQVEKKDVDQEIWRILQYSNKLNQEKPLRICMFDPTDKNLGSKTAQKYGLVHVSVRSLLNEQVMKNTLIGKKIQQNELKDEMIQDLVLMRLKKKDCQMQGFLLEGFPKNQQQTTFLINNDLLPKFLVEIIDKEPNDFIKTVEMAFQNMVFRIEQSNDMLEKISFQIDNYKQ